MNTALGDPRIITQAKLDEANKSFGLDPSNLLFKVETGKTRLVEWAEEQMKLQTDVSTFTPFDIFGVSEKVKECRETQKGSPCETDPSCTEERGNTSLFMGSWKELLEIMKNGLKPTELSDLLGLNDNASDGYVVIVEVMNRNDIRVPCGDIPSVDCEFKCKYNGEDLPLNLCEDDNNKDDNNPDDVSNTVKEVYPAVSNIVKNMGACRPNGMPFLGVGKTHSQTRQGGGIQEYIINGGGPCKVKAVSELKKLLNLIPEIQDHEDFSSFPKYGGGYRRVSKRKKSKRKKSKRKKSKRKKSKRKKSRRKK